MMFTSRDTVLFTIPATTMAVLQHVHITELLTLLTAVSLVMWFLVFASLIIRIGAHVFYGLRAGQQSNKRPVSK